MNEKRRKIGDAHAEVDEAMRSRLDDLGELVSIANGDQPTVTTATALGIDVDDPQGSAMQRLDDYPLCVEATTTFEVVLGTGGPDDRLLVECDRYGQEGEWSYEVRRVLYRYSWTGSAERELTGYERAIALELARRVVPELVE